MKYSELTRGAEALACILGPVLLLAASLFFVVGQQAVESVLGFYGIILLIPLLLALARRLGKQMPRYGLVCAALGLVGWAGGTFMMAMRGVYVALVRAEVPAIVAAGNFDAALEVLGSSAPELYAVALVAPFGPLALVLSGIGLIRFGAALRWPGVLILASGLSFITAQAHLVAIHVFYPLAMALLVAGSTPIGLELLTAQSDSEPTGWASVRG